MTRVGLLHTVPALAATLDGMLAEAFAARAADAAPATADRVHIADARLLQTAIREGVTDEVRASVAAHLRHLVDGGADAILVTCSSIGEAAEQAAAELPVPVVRVDAAMARDAVARAIEVAAAAEGARGTAHIAVLATNTATLGPTTRLIERELGAAGEVSAGRITVASAVVEGAVAAREAGHPDEHDRLIAEAVAAAVAGAGTAAPADVIVLAQASMAQAADRAEVVVPILTSPAGGVAALLAALPSVAGGAA
ncbi:aspartate/glutamate racemase family protein [Leifsonia sp. NPDC058292]|uniref:aspartate/glutamate racemase family protein n=1 Tax=Leifsonia sp. NPDC058292 TaxID=3346428 RepID=UPI0036DA316F